MGYEHDIFVSYTRTYRRDGEEMETPVGRWVKRVFYPALTDWWQMYRTKQGANDGRDPGDRIFLDDRAIPEGSTWPDYLAQAHRASRCLVPIWCPPFFDSQWCQAEWRSMVAREEATKIDTSTSHGLVIPVIYNDEQTFPKEARARQAFRCDKFAYIRSDKSKKIERLNEWIGEKLIPALCSAVDNAPEWSADFPLLKPVTRLPTGVQSVPEMGQ